MTPSAATLLPVVCLAVIGHTAFTASRMTVSLAAIALPETTTLVGQAALPGLALAVLAVVLRRFTEPRPARKPGGPSVGPASSLSRSGTPTASLIVAPAAGSISTASVGRDAS